MTESETRQERVRRLQQMYASVASESTFTERQEPTRGTVPDDGDLEARLRALVAEMRERYGFRTTLDDVALAVVPGGSRR